MAKLAEIDVKALGTSDNELLDMASRIASASKCNSTVMQAWDKMHRQSSSIVLKNSKATLLTLVLQKFEALINTIHFDQAKMYLYVPLAVYQYLNALVQLEATTLALGYLLQKYLSLMMPLVKSLPSSGTLRRALLCGARSCLMRGLVLLRADGHGEIHLVPFGLLWQVFCSGHGPYFSNRRTLQRAMLAVPVCSLS